MTNRRHFYSFKINQNASAQNFSQNPPCPDKPGKPLFLRVHAVRHNNAFCNGHPTSTPGNRSPRSSDCTARRCCLFCKTHPTSTPGNRSPRSSDCAARRCCLFCKTHPASKTSVVVSFGVVFRKLNEFQQKLHPCMHTQLLINIVYRLFNGSFGYK